MNHRRSADDSSAVINCPEQIMKKRFGKLRNNGLREYFVGNAWNFSAPKQKFWDCSGRSDGREDITLQVFFTNQSRVI
ncbi:hypothetical protein CEXT_266371 [Caerostris extrusa]|uniref:Uncharacterized protein n=1 Tax=Caerostris extrusa TaxID=172846 RepID=A0AAV4QJ34_CAEEX|nr:hypothetical protein CEXT_266371 [Caerostris extrusa]